MFVFTTKIVSSIAELFQSPKLLSRLCYQNYPDLKLTTALGNGNKNPEHKLRHI